LINHRCVEVVKEPDPDSGQHSEEDDPFSPVKHTPEIELRFGSSLKSAGRNILTRHLVRKGFHCNLQASQSGIQQRWEATKRFNTVVIISGVFCPPAPIYQ
jgi:hypothetical protein